MDTNSENLLNSSPEARPVIVDSNGLPARPDEIPPLIVPGTEESGQAHDPNDEASPEGKVLAMPQPDLERTGRIVPRGDRRAIFLIFETRLEGDRANLLLARIYSKAENAEREVMALGSEDVKRICDEFRNGAAR